jgi:hypothetical protein
MTMPNPQKYAVLDIGEKLTRYSPSFHHLGPDEHHPAEKGGRTRRLAQYYAKYDHNTKKAEITQLKTQLYVQGQSNKLLGHVPRHFDTVEDDLRSYIEYGFNVVDQNWPLSKYESEWLIHCHQIRVHAMPAVTGIPVPEGIHKDGAEFVLMGCVAREGVKGGISHIYEDEGAPPIFGVTLMAGQAILVSDRDVYHMVSPVIAEKDEGYRDMILMGFHIWSDGKYKGNWRENAIGVH